MVFVAAAFVLVARAAVVLVAAGCGAAAALAAEDLVVPVAAVLAEADLCTVVFTSSSLDFTAVLFGAAALVVLVVFTGALVSFSSSDSVLCALPRRAGALLSAPDFCGDEGAEVLVCARCARVNTIFALCLPLGSDLGLLKRIYAELVRKFLARGRDAVVDGCGGDGWSLLVNTARACRTGHRMEFFQ